MKSGVLKIVFTICAYMNIVYAEIDISGSCQNITKENLWCIDEMKHKAEQEINKEFDRQIELAHKEYEKTRLELEEKYHRGEISIDEFKKKQEEADKALKDKLDDYSKDNRKEAIEQSGKTFEDLKEQIKGDKPLNNNNASGNNNAFAGMADSLIGGIQDIGSEAGRRVYEEAMKIVCKAMRYYPSGKQFCAECDSSIAENARKKREKNLEDKFDDIETQMETTKSKYEDLLKLMKTNNEKLQIKVNLTKNKLLKEKKILFLVKQFNELQSNQNSVRAAQ